MYLKAHVGAANVAVKVTKPERCGVIAPTVLLFILCITSVGAEMPFPPAGPTMPIEPTNSPQAFTDSPQVVTPIPPSTDLGPFGTLAYSSSYLQSNAFDGVLSSMYLSETFVTPSEIGYNFGSGRRFMSYTIVYSNGDVKTRSPKDFTMQGFSNGVWTVLDTQQNQTIAVWEAAGNTKMYTIAAPAEYTQYKLAVTDDNDDREGVVMLSIGELSWDDVPTSPSPPAATNSPQVVTPIPPSTDLGPFGTLAYSSSYLQSNAFDGVPSSMYLSQTFVTPSEIGYNFGSDRRFMSYTIIYSNGDVKTRSPKDFTMQGFSNGVWTVLDTQQNQTIAVWEAAGNTKTYTIAARADYTQYKLVVTDDNDDREGVVMLSIGELSWADAPSWWGWRGATNSPQAFTDSPQVVTPIPPSTDLGPFGTLAYSSSYLQSNAFDGVPSSMYLSETFVTPSEIGYNFGSDRRFMSYTIVYSNGDVKTRSPKDFTMQGFSNGVWTVLDTQQNQTIAVWEAAGNTKMYTIAAPAEYTQYKLAVTDDNDDREGVVMLSIGELSWADAFTPPSPPAATNSPQAFTDSPPIRCSPYAKPNVWLGEGCWDAQQCVWGDFATQDCHNFTHDLRCADLYVIHISTCRTCTATCRHLTCSDLSCKDNHCDYSSDGVPYCPTCTKYTPQPRLTADDTGCFSHITCSYGGDDIAGCDASACSPDTCESPYICHVSSCGACHAVCELGIIPTRPATAPPACECPYGCVHDNSNTVLCLPEQCNAYTQVTAGADGCWNAAHCVHGDFSEATCEPRCTPETCSAGHHCEESSCGGCGVRCVAVGSTTSPCGPWCIAGVCEVTDNEEWCVGQCEWSQHTSRPWTMSQRYKCCDTDDVRCSFATDREGRASCQTLLRQSAEGTFPGEPSCCTTHDICSGSFKCYTKATLSYEEDDWCCREHNIRCAADCTADVNPGSAPYCCKVKGLHCPDTDESETKDNMASSAFARLTFCGTGEALLSSPKLYVYKLRRTLLAASQTLRATPSSLLISKMGSLLPDGRRPGEGDIQWQRDVSRAWNEDAVSDTSEHRVVNDFPLLQTASPTLQARNYSNESSIFVEFHVLSEAGRSVMDELRRSLAAVGNSTAVLSSHHGGLTFQVVPLPIGLEVLTISEAPTTPLRPWFFILAGAGVLVVCFVVVLVRKCIKGKRAKKKSLAEGLELNFAMCEISTSGHGSGAVGSCSADSGGANTAASGTELTM